MCWHTRVMDNHSQDEYVRYAVHTTTIENAWPLFKRGIIRICHQCSDQHLQRYMDEFMGRTNTRNLEDHEWVNQTLARTVDLHLTCAN